MESCRLVTDGNGGLVYENPNSREYRICKHVRGCQYYLEQVSEDVYALVCYDSLGINRTGKIMCRKLSGLCQTAKDLDVAFPPSAPRSGKKL